MNAGDKGESAQLSAPLRVGEAGLRRAILIDPRGDCVRAFLEDDFHHFEVRLRHRDGIITEVEAATIRHPWTTCAGAGPMLTDRLTGVALADAPSFDSQYAHCTHLYDLALLAASSAGEGRPALFRMFVSDSSAGRRDAILYRDAAPVIEWLLDREEILPPHAQAGLNLRTFRSWSEALPPGERLAGTLLRRAVFISIGRTFDPDVDRDIPTPPPGACYNHQPENFAPDARTIGARRDFSYGRQGPLAESIAEIIGRD